MIRALRNSCTLAAVLVFLVPAASADIKIKTRTTMMGHSTESTVYIRGARERREMSFGGRMAATMINQCDQKRMITIYGDNCTSTQAGGPAACPAAPSFGAMMRGAMSGEPSEPPRKGGTLTVTASSTDTGERQEMFGYKARHIRTTMSMESSPDACNQSHMKIEKDGWYAELSATLSCSDDSARALACGGGGGGKPNCQDRVVMKGSGGGALGFPMKETTTMTSEQGSFTTTTEVIELSTVTLEPSLFEMPQNCRVMEAAGGTAAPSAAAPPPPPAAPAASAAPPAASAAPPVAAKAAGVVRIGVVKLKDVSGEDLPTDNLRLNLMGEITSRHMDAVALNAEAPLAEVMSEARTKQCDYILFTTLKQMKGPGSGGLAAAVLPKGMKLDATRFQALSGMTLYKVGKPLPEIKDLSLAADAAQFGVDAVTATFEKEGDKVSQQVQEDAHPKSAPKAPARKPKARSNPK